MMIAREVKLKQTTQTTDKQPEQKQIPEARSAPSEQSITIVRQYLFALVVDTLILVVLGKKGQRSERSARSKYEWAEQRPDEKWLNKTNQSDQARKESSNNEN